MLLYSPSICKGVRVIKAVNDGNFGVLTHLLENELGNYINQQDDVSFIPIRRFTYLILMIVVCTTSAH